MTGPAGHTLHLALFGDPVDHSRSPDIHAAFARAAGIELRYELIRTTVHGLADRFAAFVAAGGEGANFTVPVKAAAPGLAARLTPAAQAAGAVNTVYRRDGAWIGDNTDGPGLVADLQRLGLDPAHARVLILGAGGAATGIIEPLLAAGAADIAVSNRTPERADALVERFDDGRLSRIDDISVAGRRDLVIQATSLGHRGKAPDLSGLATGTPVYDLNYGPAHAPLARDCHERGLPCHDGLGMLVEQARLAFEAFAGRRVGNAVCQAVLAELRETPEIRDSGPGTRDSS